MDHEWFYAVLSLPPDTKETHSLGAYLEKYMGQLETYVTAVPAQVSHFFTNGS